MDVITAGSLCVGFIGAFYIWPRDFRFLATALVDLPHAAEDSIFVDRDDDATVLRRTTSFVVTTTMASAAILTADRRWNVVTSGVATTPVLATTLLESPSVRPIVAVLLLFSGHIIEQGTALFENMPSDYSSRLRFFRDILLSPAGEEIFFRGLLFHVLQHRGAVARICISAGLFSLSHIHHVIVWAAESYRENYLLSAGSNPENKAMRQHNVRQSWRRATVRTSKVLIVTAVFGLLSGYFFTYTCKDNLIPVVLVHSICNFFGPPEFLSFRRNGNPRVSRFRRGMAVVSYCLGITAFVYLVR